MKTQAETNRIAPRGGDGVPSTTNKAADLFLEAFADAIADRLERRQESRRRLLKLEAATEYLSTSDDTIYRLIAEKKLTPVRNVDRHLRFDIRELDKLIEEAKDKT